MNDRAAHHISAITDNLHALFADYCGRTAPPGLETMLQDFRNHRLDLVLTVHVTATGTEFICCALPIGGELVRLFTVCEVPSAPDGRVH